ncbi:hypothetical protein RND71_038527 [Anisodus tanguticus]|uniref:Uncharacterized protein n=1 Tax=Anisodus tanguticus TaxID=243964 RepID=A0AAE1R080_9SOLA|nr:hypothetical protein RND71_038527 [Anisodus tanguticus]
MDVQKLICNTSCGGRGSTEVECFCNALESRRLQGRSISASIRVGSKPGPKTEVQWASLTGLTAGSAPRLRLTGAAAPYVKRCFSVYQYFAKVSMCPSLVTITSSISRYSIANPTLRRHTSTMATRKEILTCRPISVTIRLTVDAGKAKSGSPVNSRRRYRDSIIAGRKVGERV